MPVATPPQYGQMIDEAQKGNYAFPAINITSLVTLNAALKGFADKKSDGIIQMSLGGGKFASGLGIGDSVEGAIVLAEATHRLAEKYDIFVALHTDHCQAGIDNPIVRARMEADAAELGVKLDLENKGKYIPAEALDSKEKKKRFGWINKVPPGDDMTTFLKRLIQATADRRAAGQGNLFQSHMLDASVLPLDLNMQLSRSLLEDCAANDIILEVEAGVVGGEEDGIDHSDVPSEDLYTTPDDMLAVYEALHGAGRYMFAATFGNVHGHYKPGAVKLRPDILRDGQNEVENKHGRDARFDLVFHGGSGTPRHELEATLEYGVIKMNIDTDTQYAFSRPIATHFFRNFDGVMKIDGEIGDKKTYDPRSYLKAAEKNVAERLGRACDDLRSSGKTLFR